MSEEATEPHDGFTIPFKTTDDNEVVGDKAPSKKALIVVCPKLQRTGTREIRLQQEPYKPIINAPLEVRHCADIIAVRKQLVDEFPYAISIVDSMLMPTLRRMSTGRIGVVLEPTLIYGAPGLGKSRLAARICNLLGLYTRTVSIAGANDDMIFGLSKGWSTAQASIITDAVLESMSANPVIILDELEKANTHSRNGNIHHKLLPLLEKSEAGQWNEPLLGVQVNFSHIGWVFTANDLENIAPPLRSRIRCLEMTPPSSCHLPLILNNMRNEIAHDQGIDVRWLRSLDLCEMSALQRTYKQHRSLRILKRQLEFVFEQQNVAST